MPNIPTNGTSGKPGEAAILDWFRLLYDGAPGHIVVWSKHDGSCSFPAAELELAASFAQGLSRKTNVYFGIGLHRQAPPAGERGKAEAVCVIPGLWMDLDVKGPAHTEENLPETEDEARSLLAEFPLQPTAIIHSGHGLQAYWLLKEPWVFENGDNEKARALSERFQRTLQEKAEARGWKLDSTHDLARVFRPPGTLNHKNSTPVPVRLVSLDAEKRYEAEDFEPYIVADLGGTAATTSKNFDGPPPEIEPIVKGCGWLRHCRDDAAKLPEPEWYAMLGIVGRCKDGSQIAHDWSKTYPGYSPAETDEKLKHAIESAGPRTCRKIRSQVGGKTYCDSCPYWMNITSPIVLGSTSNPKEEMRELIGLILSGTEEKDEDGEERDPKKELANLLKRGTYYQAAVEVAARCEFPKPFLEVLVGVVFEIIGSSKFSADVLRVHHHFAIDRGKLLYIFEGGAYRSTGEVRTGQMVQRYFEHWGVTKHWHTRRTSEVAAYIATCSPELWECPPIHTINVRNGLLDWRTGKLRPHDPEFLNAVQLPVEFKAGAKCPAWEKFVADVFPKDAKSIAWQLAAWLCIPMTSLQKAVMLTGSGGNGKSVFLGALTAFLGRENVATAALQRLECDRFATAGLVGRLANIAADLPGTDIPGSSVFKSIVGGDRIDAERKFKDSFSFTPFCRLIFSTNTPPTSADSSPGYWQRWIVVPFDRQFRGSKLEVKRHVLDSRLAAAGELSGLLNRAIAELPNLLENGFSECDSIARAKEEFIAQSDPVSVWIEAHTRDHFEAFVSKQDLQRAYSQYAASKGLPRLSAKGFSQAVRRLRPKLQDGQRTVAGIKGVWCWLGIGLVTEKNQEDEDRETAGYGCSREPGQEG